MSSEPPFQLSTRAQWRIALRRLCFAVLVLATTGALAFQALRLLSINGMNPIETAMFAIFVVLVTLIVFSFWTAVFGFLLELWGRDSLALSNTLVEESPADFSQFRTAVVIPAYNEDTVRLFAGLRATYESVAETGHLAHFDFFILSDTTDPDLWIREEMAFHELRQEVSDPDRLKYRNRRENSERKSGNIAEFCARWGDDYRYMIVFDADSLMTGEALVTLVRLMEKHPAAGIIQTPPIPVNRRSLFGRLMQFAARAYGPMFSKGLNYWQAGEGNYWGHNAIIRIRPFIDHCELPKLPGKAPLGGSILSHDFVEAALMCRAGWKVFLAADLEGSYEEAPNNIISHAARERRWCQGNLQHARLLTMPKLHWISRVHLALGVMSYVSAPLWMLLLVLGTIEGLRIAFTDHTYFMPDESPFPVWEISIVNESVLLFLMVMSMLIVPKLLSLFILLTRHRRSVAGFGNSIALTASVLVEIVFSILIAPVWAMLYTRFVLGILMGWNVEWNAQDRGDVETSFGEACRRHCGITALGLFWTGLLYAGAPDLLLWFSPILAGFVFAIPLSMWSSRISAGRWAKALRLLLTPEESDPPAILRRFHTEFERAATRPWASSEDGLTRVLDDPQVRSVHLSLLPPAPPPGDPMAEHHLEGLRLKVRTKGESSLRPNEKRELLWDTRSIEALSRQ